MCGIFGYVGYQTDASQKVLTGLKLLEYRGYDSWGIAVKNHLKIVIEKHVGKIGDADTILPESSIGIGHTRWATHGGVTVENAHPHLDCTHQIAVLHNGIIENYQELKEKLRKKRHEFVSQTDTEVMSHLVEEYCKTHGFSTSVRLAFNELKGLSAFLVINAASGEIVAVKNGSPLVVGVGKGEYFVASDATGIIFHTNRVIFLKDHEMVILGKTLQLFSLPNGEKLKPKIETVDWKIEDANKGTYDHFMMKEIYEQPKVIRNIAQNYGQQIETLAKVVEKAKGTFLIGAGTASYACLAGIYLFSKIAKKHVNMAAASEFNYLEDFLNKKSLIIALSQSGETIDIVEPLTRAKIKGAKIVAMVNALGSTIYRMADYKMLLGAGPEKAVASTKAYIAKLAILLMLSFAMTGQTNKAKQLLLNGADEIERLLDEKQVEKIKKLAILLKNKEHMYVIGRGVSYPSALEAAMKIKEISYLHTEGLAGGELKHGPIALISQGTPCIVFAPKDETYDAMISNTTEIKARGGYIIGIGPQNASVFDYWIEVKNLQDASVITQIIPIQILAYYLAIFKGYDADKPRNLAKSVVVK